MFFCNDHREAVAAELGSSATNQVAKVLGEKWAQTTERQAWERLAAQDKVRHETEMSKYNAELEAEAEEERRAKEAAASGPSDREVERDAKRAQMQEDAARREAAPKKPKKERVLTEGEKSLKQQNKVGRAKTASRPEHTHVRPPALTGLP